MPLYEYACGCGARFEKMIPFADADSPSLGCPACGAAGPRRVIASAALLGQASPPPGRDAAPRSWEQAGHGDRELVGQWHRTLEKRQKLEEKYPELAGDTRPVLAHEGRYSRQPLRADAPSPSGDA